jgi:hypothetical protein
MNLDGSDLYVSKDESFYDTVSHKMAKDSIQTEGKVTNLDSFAKAVYKEKQKEEKVKKEEILVEDEIDLGDFFK